MITSNDRTEGSITVYSDEYCNEVNSRGINSTIIIDDNVSILQTI